MMKIVLRPRLIFLRLVTAAFAGGLLLDASAQPVIMNPSFEADAVPPAPGYGTITDWTPGGGIGTSYGINEANGQFADNGTIPEGTNIAFMQHSGTRARMFQASLLARSIG